MGSGIRQRALAALLLAVSASPIAAQESRGFRPQSKSGQEAASPQETKVALVIGNGGYDWSPLRNPVNDARSMSEALEDLGFKVLHQTDASQAGMKRAIREFGSELRQADVGLFYYAGHGIQASGRNYLIPVNAEINSEPEVEYESVDLGFVVAQMEAAGSPLNIVILDACRNNPFAGSFRSADRGLTQVLAPTGTLIAYATAPGSVASDGDGDNGLYTQELLRFMRTPGLEVEDVFKQVRISLMKLTNGQQTPWESSSLVGEFSFATQSEAPAYAQAEPTEQVEPIEQVEPQATTSAAPAQPKAPTAAAPAAGESQANRAKVKPVLEQSGGAAHGSVPVAQQSIAGETGGAASEVSAPVETLAAPGQDEVERAFEACIGVLEHGDLEMFDEYFVRETVPGSLANVRDWIENATGRSAAAGRGTPTFTDAATEATVNGSARLTWRHSFGGNRSADVSLEVALVPVNGRWRVDGCGLSGKVKRLR